MMKSRVGILLGAAALLLALSPDARKTMRKWAVKGTESVLDLTDQVKGTLEKIQQDSNLK